ncbi:IS200/IS605 family transposase [Yersinia enterocolitica]|nr:IS200/IS605 family transposase [Yersinia enterocolitica]
MSRYKNPFDLLKHLAVWQLQWSNKKSKGVQWGRKELSAHRWNCKYHIVSRLNTEDRFSTARNAGQWEYLRKLCEWKNVHILEAECCADHIHMLVEIREDERIKLHGYLKGKSSLMLYEQFGDLKFKYRNREFWCRGIMWIRWVKYLEDPDYIKHQLEQDKLGNNYQFRTR